MIQFGGHSVEWNTGMECWNKALEWSTGMESWTGVLDWSAGLECWRAWSMILWNNSLDVFALSGVCKTGTIVLKRLHLQQQ
jgi:hypothetical protein